MLFCQFAQILLCKVATYLYKKLIVLNIVTILATRKEENCFSPPLSVLVGPGMDENHDPGSGINIPDPQHWGKF